MYAEDWGQVMMLTLKEAVQFCEDQLMSHNGKSGLEFCISHEKLNELFISRNRISYLKNTNEKGLGIRSGYGFYYTTGFSIDKIQKGVEEVIQVNSILKQTLPLVEPDQIQFVDDLESDSNPISLSILKSYAENLLKEVKKKSYSIQIESLKITNQVIWEVVLNSKGLKMAEKRKIFVVDGLVFIRKGNNISPFYVIYDGADSLDNLTVIEAIDEIFDKKYLDIPEINLLKESKVDVLLSPYAVYQLIVEPILSNCEGNQILNGQSYFRKEDLGKQIFSEKLCIEDHNQMKNFIRSKKFDREGKKMEPFFIVKNGILTNFLLDSSTARALNLPSTHRASGGVDDIGLIMPTNTVVSGQKKDLKNILKEIKEGLWVERFSGNVNRNNGYFSGAVRPAYYIKNGQVVGSVKGVMMSGNGLDLAKNIIEISSNQEKLGNLLMPFIWTGKVSITI